MLRETVSQALGTIARDHGHSPAVMHMETGVRYSYGDLLKETDLIASGLLAHGIGRGNTVGLLAPNV
ncbi:MAG: AMP-binding protein, partial [Deltaproteobacteria bacterium]